MASCSFVQFTSDFCLSTLDNEAGWVQFLVEVSLFLYAFGGLALSADHMCNSMETLCDHFRIPGDVGGATFMAFGSAVPEITVNAIATLTTTSITNDEKNDPADLGLGAILGSGLIALLLIPSISAFFAPDSQLVLATWSLGRDIFSYVAALTCVIIALHVGGPSLEISLALLFLYILYLICLMAPRTAVKTLKTQNSIFRDRYEASGIDSEEVYQELQDEEASTTNSAVLWSAEKLLNVIMFPMEKAMKLTCPDCRITKPRENYYFVTFVTSFAWITLWSAVITNIANRWVTKMHEPSTMGLLGLTLVAIGAEIPDTINAVTVARRGYGSMSTSSCVGSQIINICVGLGLPWSIVLLFRKSQTRVPLGINDSFLHLAAYVQLGNTLLVAAALLGTAFVFRRKAVVDRCTAKYFFSLYVIIITGFIVYFY